MRRLIQDVDRLLRGGYTSREALESGRLGAALPMLLVSGSALGAAYGVFMGLYGALRPGNPSVAQLLATTIKVPFLFLATLVVTFPSLYVFSALAGSRLLFLDTLRLLLAAVTVNLALLASFGPITAFFTLSTENYPFMVVLNVVLFAVAGAAGLGVLRRALQVVFEPARAPAAPPPVAAPPRLPAEEGEPALLGVPPLRRPRTEADRARTVFRIWMVIYGIVGAQMGWILRPFIGSPDLPFELFRERRGSFFQGFLDALRRMLVS
jgi:hypothetical protein